MLAPRLAVALLALAAVVLGGCSASDAGARTGRAAERVERVVDGDTVVLSGVGKARLIGVDTPEVFGGSECFGREASAFARRVLRPGRRVHVRLGVEPRDRYGRLLAYVERDAVAISAQLVRQGFADTLEVAPNTGRADTYARLRRSARRDRRGLWGACRG